MGRVTTAATIENLRDLWEAESGHRSPQDVRRITDPAALVENYFGVARVTIEGQNANVDILEVPDGCPVLVGQIPLELKDFVRGPASQRIVPNPAHRGRWTLDLY
jgi:hypothetical protein